MPAHVSFARSHGLTRTLCIVILVTMVLAVLYAGWIAVSNFSRIGV